MPRIHNLYDFSASTQKPLPYGSLIEVLGNDSIRMLTIRIEPNDFVQLDKIIKDGIATWQITTNIEMVTQVPQQIAHGEKGEKETKRSK